MNNENHTRKTRIMEPLLHTDNGIPVYLHDDWEFSGTPLNNKANFIAQVVGSLPSNGTKAELIVWFHNTLIEMGSIWWIRPITFQGQPLNHGAYKYKYTGQEVPDGVEWPEVFIFGEINDWTKGWYSSEENEVFARCPIADYCEACDRPKASCTCVDPEADIPPPPDTHIIACDEYLAENTIESGDMFYRGDDWKMLCERLEDRFRSDGRQYAIPKARYKAWQASRECECDGSGTIYHRATGKMDTCCCEGRSNRVVDQPANLPEGWKAYRLTFGDVDDPDIPHRERGLMYFLLEPGELVHCLDLRWHGHDGLTQRGFMYTDDYLKYGTPRLSINPFESDRDTHAAWIVFSPIKGIRP